MTTPDLKPAIPPFTVDVETPYMELGKLFVYVKQLSNELTNRAKELNNLDDARIAAIERCNEAERKLGEATEKINMYEKALNDGGYVIENGEIWVK